MKCKIVKETKPTLATFGKYKATGCVLSSGALIYIKKVGKIVCGMEKFL